MNEKTLGHIKLGTDNFASNVTKTFKLDIDLSVNRKVIFEYKSITRETDPDSSLPLEEEFLEIPPTPLLNIHIKESCFVQMFLKSDTIDWYWRSEDAITVTEEHARQLYHQLEYFDNGRWVSRPRDGVKCRRIRFGAIRRPNPEGPKDPFNMNVILDWGNQFLPITIDPDIQNPKV